VIDDSIVESDETVVVTLAAGAGYTLGIPSSATVRIKDDEPAVVVVDDPAATLVGTWTVSTAFPNYYGSGYRHDGNAGKGSKSATFTPNLPAAGNYGVYIWYTADAGRANNVPVDIVYNGGSTTVSVNQQVNGAKWNLLGTYSFSAGTGGLRADPDHGDQRLRDCRRSEVGPHRIASAGGCRNCDGCRFRGRIIPGVGL
jgi:hypothetical protein